MKVKNVLITLLVLAGISTGGVYGAVRYSRSHQKKVQVAPVSNVSMEGDFWDDEEEAISGNILAINTQAVQLDSEYDLLKVFVEEGDAVKIGDPLLEYDMTKEQLEREMEELRGQINEMTLASQEKYLEKLLKNPAAAMASSSAPTGFGDDGEPGDDDSDEDDDDEMTASPDESFDESFEDEELDGDQETLFDSDEEMIEDSALEDGLNVSDDSGEDLLVDDLIDDGADQPVEDNSLSDLPEDVTDDSLFEDDLAGLDDDIDYQLSSAMNAFIMIEQDIRKNQYEEYEEDGHMIRDTSKVEVADLTRALELFEAELAAEPDKDKKTIRTIEDVFGEERDISYYVLSKDVKEVLSRMQAQEEADPDRPAPINAAETQITLYKAYANLLYYDFAVKMGILENALNLAGVTAETADASLAERYQVEIEDAVDSFYRFSYNWKKIKKTLMKKYDLTEEDLEKTDEKYQGLLKSAAGKNKKLGDLSDGTLSALVYLTGRAAQAEEEQNVATVNPAAEASAVDHEETADEEETPDEEVIEEENEELSEEDELIAADSMPEDDSAVVDPIEEELIEVIDPAAVDGQEPDPNEIDEPSIEPESPEQQPADQEQQPEEQEQQPEEQEQQPEEQPEEQPESPEQQPADQEQQPEEQEQQPEEQNEQPAEQAEPDTGYHEDDVYNDDNDTADLEIAEFINEFLVLEQLIRTYQYNEDEDPEDGHIVRDISGIVTSDLWRALEIFEEELAAMPDPDQNTVVTMTDAFGETREVNVFILSQEVIGVLDRMQERDEAAQVSNPVSSKELQRALYEAYANVLYYDLAYKMGTLDKIMAEAGVTPDTADETFTTTFSDQIKDAVTAYYRLSINWSVIRQLMGTKYDVPADDLTAMDEEYRALLQLAAGANEDLPDETDGVLSKLIAIINHVETIEDPVVESESEFPVPVPDPGDGGFGDDGDDGDDEGDEPEYTQEELEEAIRDAEDTIKETKLSIRENELRLKQLDRKLSQKVIRSTINGVIKSAGKVGEPNADDAFIVVTGSSGMYVQGSVNELKLDTVKVGDKLTGVSDENGESFTARVTEISTYPTNDEDSGFYYWYSSGNGNSSTYPFLAYIDDASELVEGSVQMQFTNQEKSTGIYLENAYLRQDSEGKDYVMIKGEDGLLKKQIVKTGKSLWGSSTEIISGLSSDDMIAFPYGRSVKEGAPTEDVDYFEEYE